jgi:nifR3 family TIM-barrel protein
MQGFWNKLNKPILALAPMYDVTDEAFRFVIAKYGKPDVMWTEFVSAEGLASAGFERLKHHLVFDDSERPIVAQIFGKDPNAFFKTAELLQNLKFDGIDINMGCPDKNIMKQGSCAALYKNPKLAQELIQAAQKGAPNLPVSVKIRIGDAKIDWQPWIAALLETSPAAISIHLRTRKEMSKVPAHWELMPEIVKFIHSNTSEENRPKILGNGDIKDIPDALEKINTSGADGVMLGRAIFGNPWLFSKNKTANSVSAEDKMRIMLEHAMLFEKKFSGIKSFEIMKKHFKAYVSGFEGAAELRLKLMQVHSAGEVQDIVSEYLESLKMIKVT